MHVRCEKENIQDYRGEIPETCACLVLVSFD